MDSTIINEYWSKSKKQFRKHSIYRIQHYDTQSESTVSPIFFFLSLTILEELIKLVMYTLVQRSD